MEELGYGPLSHVFNSFFVPELQKRKGLKKIWSVDKQSKILFDYMVSEYEIPC